jgi:hypothetical protein
MDSHELKSSKFNEHSPAGRASWSFFHPPMVLICVHTRIRHATVTLAVSQHSGRERERNKEDEERAEAGERAQGLKASPRNPRPRLASRSLPLLRWPPLPSPCDSIQDG